jgi:hypothetical protein
VEDKIRKTFEIYKLSLEFETEAKRLAAIIVDQLSLPPQDRQVLSIDAGGIAGGGKFYISSVLIQCREIFDWKHLL